MTVNRTGPGAACSPAGRTGPGWSGSAATAGTSRSHCSCCRLCAASTGAAAPAAVTSSESCPSRRLPLALQLDLGSTNSIPSDSKVQLVSSSYRIHLPEPALAAGAELRPACSDFGHAAPLALTAD